MAHFIARLILMAFIAVIAIGGVYHIKPYIQIAPAEAANGHDMSEKANDYTQKIDQPVVVELFTSQGCYSCPPAEAFLRDLAVRNDIIALEFHVDYWDDLVYGLAGKWKDPFSSPQFTKRQSDYNYVIRKKNQNYTPQMVIDGTYETVGSQKSRVNSLIRKALSDRKNITLRPTLKNNQDLTLNIKGDVPNDTRLYFAIYNKRDVTNVSAGENKGKSLASYNIVHTYGLIAPHTSGTSEYTHKLPTVAKDDHCVVLAQNPKTLKIHAAGLCQKI